MGVVSIVICAFIAVFAVVILYLTRSNIIDLLDKDVIMYDKNYDLKKESIEEAFNCLDAISQNGAEIKNNAQFVARAKQAYNGLLCTLNSAKLYQEFYRIAIDNTDFNYSIQDIENFKIACRGELISKHKRKNEQFKGATRGALDGMIKQNQPTVQNPTPRQPQQPQQNHPQRPQPKPRPQQTPKSTQDDE